MLRIFVLCSALMVAACGFHPLYATNDEDAGVRRELAAINVEYKHDLLAQSVATAVKKLINPDSIQTKPRYTLALDATSSYSALAIQLDQQVTRYKVTVTVHYTLADAQTNKVVADSSISRQGGYDAVESDYAIEVSRMDTERRVAKELAEDVKLDIVSAIMKQDEASPQS